MSKNTGRRSDGQMTWNRTRGVVGHVQDSPWKDTALRDLGGVREKSALWVLRLMSESCEKLELVLPGEEENTKISVMQKYVI